MKLKLVAVFLVSSVLLSACGGGGSKAGTSVFSPGTTGTTATAAAVNVVLSDTKFNNGDTTGTVVATATAVDSSGKALPDVKINFNVTGGIYTQTSGVTDANGQNVANIKLGSDKSNRTITVVASDGVNSDRAYISVIGAKVSSVANPAVVAPNTAGAVTFTLKDSNSVALANQRVEVQTTGGLPAATGTTDVNGEYVYSYTAPATAGTVTVTASSLGVVTTQDVLIQSSSSSIPTVTSSIAGSIEINPSVVSVNPAGSSVNKAIVRAKFIDPVTNQALKNVRVKFDLDRDVFSVGGTFTASEVYSDAEGYAVTSYVPGTVPSPSGGLTIRACYVGSGDASAACSTGGFQTMTKTMTVVSSSVSVTVGTDENIYVDEDLVYYRRFVVQVVDGSGFAKANVTITPQLDLIRYAKGSYAIGTVVGVGTRWGRNTYFECVNEDTNRNNFLETTEDINHSGALEPRRADAAVSYEGTGRATDVNGRIILRVTYPRSVATWAEMQLTVTGSVDGSEGRAVKTEVLPAPADAFTTVTSSPAFTNSPYGTDAAAVTFPTGTVWPDGSVLSAGASVLPCQNPY